MAHSISRKKKRKRALERDCWWYKEMQDMRLTTGVKSYVKYWSKMKPEEIGMILNPFVII
jgi:hypothetical protein